MGNIKYLCNDGACYELFRKTLRKVSKNGVAEDIISSRWLT